MSWDRFWYVVVLCSIVLLWIFFLYKKITHNSMQSSLVYTHCLFDQVTLARLAEASPCFNVAMKRVIFPAKYSPNKEINIKNTDDNHNTAATGEGCGQNHYLKHHSMDPPVESDTTEGVVEEDSSIVGGISSNSNNR
jgi:hypothetical protein